MKTTIFQINNRVLSLLNIIVPLFFYGILLAIPIPYSISKTFVFYSIPFFLLILILYYLNFRLPEKLCWLGGATLTLILLALRLSFLWTSGYSNDMVIGGLIPFRDAFDYYHGAKFISVGQLISNNSNGATWRPLFPGFLSSMLFIFQQNFQWSLAVLVVLAGICYYLSAYLINRNLGSFAAAVYMSFLYFYIQPLIGTAYTEPLGLAFGCLGFVLLWAAAKKQNVLDLIFGLIIFTLALSVRAGAFFILPALILWSGWAFRSEKRFSLKYAGISAVALLITFISINTVYDRLVVQPGGVPFGNFAATLYGQVVGGAGYNWAFRVLPSRNAIFIYRAAGRYFLAHPLSFFIGAYKAYRDFFLPQMGILSFLTGSEFPWLGISIWIIASLLLLWGLFKSIRNFALPESSLLIAAFAGILVSIPFLPPIDGGIRIYASSMPFIFVFAALGIGQNLSITESAQGQDGFAVTVKTMSIILGILTVLLPVIVLHINKQPAVNAVSCPDAQVPYAVTVNPGSYIDLVPNAATACGRVPEICLRDFQQNISSNDPSNQAVYQHFIAWTAGKSLRLFAAQDIVQGEFHFFAGPAADFPNVSKSYVIAGCATKINVPRRPDIYQIQSVNIP
ncbi:MAG: hypothetical protein WCA79_11165 [Anaerolineales bacterium]